MADTLKATPRNELLYQVGSGLQRVKDAMNKQRQLSQVEQRIRGNIPQFPLGDLVMGQSPEAIQDYSYAGSSPFRGTRNIQTLQVDPRLIDVAGVTPMLAPAAKIAKRGLTAIAPDVAMMAEKYALQPQYIVPPEGNLNFRPAVEAGKIKGPEKQRAGDMLRQLRNKPGITKEALDEIRDRIVRVKGTTNKVMTKAEFESFVEPSKYEKVDLQRAAKGDIEHYMDEAHQQVGLDDAITQAGVPQRYMNDAMMLQYGDIEFHELDPLSQRILGRIYGIDESMSPEEIKDTVENINYDYWHEAVYDRAEMLREMDMDEVGGPYPYEGVQRLVGSQPEGSYFELGVTHPAQREEYRHYRSEEAPEGLIGHIRGSHLIDPTGIYGGVETLPNSYIVEEIQSDAQKIADQTGHLRQVHGTLAKAAIQDAIERGADRIYFPTSYSIGTSRARPPTEYASIYDQAIQKEALDPLVQKYGVQLEPQMGSYLMPETTPRANPTGKIIDVPYFQKLELTPELKRQLELEGQQTPGYAKGGEVLKATPRNEAMYGVGDVLSRLKEALNAKRPLTALERQMAGKYANPENQWSIGDLLLGQAPEALKDWSYQGSSPVHGTRNIQTTTVDPRVVDVAAVAAPLADPALRLAKAAAPTIARQAVNLVDKYGVSPVMNVVKPEGPSNWLPGSVERTTDRLKQRPRVVEVISSDMLIDRNLLPIWREMHTTQHSAILPNEQADFLAKYYPEKLRDFGFVYTPQDQAVNTFIDKRLNKYIRNEMGTESDPVRALAERGVLHFNPDPVAEYSPNVVKNQIALRRSAAGFPAGGSAESDLARNWENLSDFTIEGKPVSRWKEEADPKVLAKMPWIEHLGPADTIWERTDSGMRSRLGLDHLVDELKNAVDPDSTLPQHLRLSNKQLEQMPMERAVEHVSKINDWRAAEAARAEQEGLKANLSASARLEDTSFNPSFAEGQGGKWVDIPETTTGDGAKLCTDIGKAGGWCTQGGEMARRYGSGDNRLATLIDNDGRPHAQVTIASEDKFPSWEVSKKFIPQARQKMADQLAQAGKSEEEIADILSRDEATIKIWATYMSRDAMPKSITELKPVGNSINSAQAREYARRDPEYQSKVQRSVVNFLNSGNWKSVPKNDLEHLEIARLPNGKFYTYDQVREGIAKAAQDESATLSAEQVERWTRRPEQFTSHVEGFKDRLWPQYEKFFAAGGLVDYDEDQIDKLSDEIMNFEEGGYVQKASRYGRKGQYRLAKMIGIGPEVEFATEIPERYFPANEQHNARGDAMRHMLLQAQLAKRSPLLAKTVGWAHENLSGPQGDAEKAMDEYNDELGRQIGLTAKDKADMVYQALQAIDKGRARTLTKEQMGEGYAEGGLVYNDAHIDSLADQLLGVK